MKEAFPDFLGSDRLRRRLGEDICADRLAHAYILEGASGFGKHALALRIAASLACENKSRDGVPIPCMTCPSCKKILGGFSPDVITVSRGDKATLGVEAIREMHGDVFIPPNDLEDKIYLIEDAHLLTVQAQNAFLLTLEEPPKYVRFFLLCESSASLLETVRSRSQTLRLEPVPKEEISSFLLRTDKRAQELLRSSPREYEEILTSASGSIGQALAMLDPKIRKERLACRDNARALLRLFSGKHNSGAVLSYLNSLGQKRDEILEEFTILQLCLRDLILCKQTERAPLCFFPDREEALDTATLFSTPDLLNLFDSVEQATEALKRNANIRLTLTGFAVRAGLLN